MKIAKPRKRKFFGEKATTSLRLPKDLVAFYEKQSSELGRTFSDVIIDVLDEVAQQWSDDINAKKKSK